MPISGDLPKLIKSSLDRFTNDLRAISSKELAIFTALQNELANKKDLSDTRNGRFDERLARIIGYTGKLKAERYTTQDELYNKVNERSEEHTSELQSLLRN